MNAEHARRDPQIQAWLRRREGATDPLPVLNDEKLQAYAFLIAQREVGGSDLLEPHIQRAIEQTLPAARAPKWTDHAEDLWHVFSQPEMRELWSAWDIPRPAGTTGPAPNTPAAKAVMCVLAMCGITPYVDDAYRTLADSPRIVSVFEHLHELSGGAQSFHVPLGRHAHKSVGELFERLSSPANRDRMRVTLAKICAALREFDDRTCRTLILDGSAVPAWARQKKGRDDTEEAVLNGRTPDAFFKAYTHTRGGKQNLSPGDTVKARHLQVTKGWRGYLWLSALDPTFDIAGGGRLLGRDNPDEADGLVPLLSDVHRDWRDATGRDDLDVRFVVGDKAYDEEWAHELCLRSYGATLVAPLKDTPTTKAVSRNVSKQIESFDHHGIPVCRAHGKPLRYSTAYHGSRDGLRAGQLHENAGHFRVRFVCEHETRAHPPCGRPGLPMYLDWRRLGTLPHHPSGAPDKYALRIVLLARQRNLIESHFQRLHARLLGLGGGGRTRLTDYGTVEALLLLCELSMAALQLADERLRRGREPDVPPPLGLWAGRPVVLRPAAADTTAAAVSAGAPVRQPSGQQREAA